MLKSQPQGSNLNLKTQIPAPMLKFQPWRSNASNDAQTPDLMLKFQPQGSDLRLYAQILATMLKFKLSIGHKLLRGLLPPSLPYRNICLLRDNGHRWPSDALATFLFSFSHLQSAGGWLIWSLIPPHFTHSKWRSSPFFGLVHVEGGWSCIFYHLIFLHTMLSSS